MRPTQMSPITPKASSLLFAAILLCACSLTLSAQSIVPAQIIVTMGHSYGLDLPVLTANDLTILQDDHPRTITAVTPLNTNLELFVLVDNCSSCEAGPQFQDLTRFIDSQPTSTSIGVAYIQSGKLHVALDPTPDRALARKALTPPSGSPPSSPYYALADLIQSWKPTSSRRAVLMISTGLDPDRANPMSRSDSAEAALQAAQRAQVTIFAIYHPGADFLSQDYSKVLVGQDQLSHVAYESGGEAYFLGAGPLLSLAPFLADIRQHLSHQYLVEFLTTTSATPNELRDLQIQSKLPDLDLMAPSRVVVSGKKAHPKTSPPPAH